MSKPVAWILSCVIAYLLGSVNCGLIISKAFHGPNLREVGSGSVGATNVQRSMGWKFGIMTLLGDGFKAMLACWIGVQLCNDPYAALLCGLLAVIGHNWPVFSGFKGGKGVAASAGVMLFCYPIPALVCIALTIALIAVIRYVSVGSMFLLISFAAVVSVLYSGGDWLVIGWAMLLAVLCVWQHRSNIQRLCRGTENRLGHSIKQ